MLKAEVTLSGVINRAAVARTAKDGRNYITFGVAVTLMQRNGEQSRFDISVSMDAQPFDAPSFTEGQRVDLTGELVFKKRGDAFYLNLYAKSSETVDSCLAVCSLKKILYFCNSFGYGAKHDTSVGNGLVPRDVHFAP